MDSFPICNSDTADRKGEVEQVAFLHVSNNLQNMAFCSLLGGFPWRGCRRLRQGFFEPPPVCRSVCAGARVAASLGTLNDGPLWPRWACAVGR